MAKVGKDELLEGITEHAGQVYGKLMLAGISDPQPRQFVLAGIALKLARDINGLPPLPRAVVVGAFRWLIPDAER